MYCKLSPKILFLFFPRTQALTCHANCLLRQFAWYVKAYVLGKIRKIFQNVINRTFYPAYWMLNVKVAQICCSKYPLCSPAYLSLDCFKTFCMLGKHFSKRYFEIFFLIFPRKQDLTLHENCLLRRQFAWSVRSYFLGKIRKISSVCHLLNMPITW